jgi:hypothetical protein
LSRNSLPITGLQGETTGQSWFEVIAHGMGVYFIGKGLFIARQLYLSDETVRALRWLASRADDEAEAARKGKSS